MQGLKTQESKKFNNFFAIVQKAAKNKNAIFFLEAGDGRDFEANDIEGEDLQGWLIPRERAIEFETKWRNNAIDSEWEEFFSFAIWHRIGDNIEITFV